MKESKSAEEILSIYIDPHWQVKNCVEEIVLAMQEYSSTQRQQARKLVFENNKPVSDHVNETFEGLNKLTEDSEIVWWYKELIVQTVLHFTLQEREKAIEAVDNFIHGQIQSVKLWDAKDALIEHLKKLKTP